MLKSRLIKYLLYLLLNYTSTHRCYSITVLDSKKALNYPQYNFNGKKCKQLFNNAKTNLTSVYNKSVSDLRSHPVSSSLAGTSLTLSLASWSNCFNLNKIKLNYVPNDLKGLVKSVLDIIMIPTFNGNSLVNIFSLYYTLRELESSKGSINTLKLYAFDAFFYLLFSYFFNDKTDFSKFSRSLLILSCFVNPQDEVLFYGLFATKKLYLPVYLLVFDFLFSLEPITILEGILGTSFGVLTGLTYQFLSSRNLIKF